jgi:hypothetical protein
MKVPSPTISRPNPLSESYLFFFPRTEHHQGHMPTWATLAKGGAHRLQGPSAIITSRRTVAARDPPSSGGRQALEFSYCVIRLVWDTLEGC